MITTAIEVWRPGTGHLQRAVFVVGLPFLLATRQRCATKPGLAVPESPGGRIETTTCTVDAEGHSNAMVRLSEHPCSSFRFPELSQSIWSSPYLSESQPKEVDMFARNVSFI